MPTADLPHDDGVGGSRVTSSISSAIARAVEAWESRTGDEAVLVVTEREQGRPVTSYCVQLAQVAVPEHLFHYVMAILHPDDKGVFQIGSKGTGAFELVEFEVGKKAVFKAKKG